MSVSENEPFPPVSRLDLIEAQKLLEKQFFQGLNRVEQTRLAYLTAQMISTLVDLGVK